MVNVETGRVALHFMYYNFVRIHKTLRITLAMAAGVTDRLWEVADIAALVEAAEAKPGKRGSYKSGSRSLWELAPSSARRTPT
jgi:hypothetical protein